jgi:hypothetical protein
MFLPLFEPCFCVAFGRESARRAGSGREGAAEWPLGTDSADGTDGTRRGRGAARQAATKGVRLDWELVIENLSLVIVTGGGDTLAAKAQFPRLAVHAAARRETSRIPPPSPPLHHAYHAIL